MLDQFVEFAIHVDNLIRAQTPSKASVSPPATSFHITGSEPMQIGQSNLTPEERYHHIQQHLCLYYGQAGHLKATCQPTPSQFNTFTVSSCNPLTCSSNCMELPVILTYSEISVTTMPMLDSGAACNFIDEFARAHDIPLNPCDFSLAVEALDGHPIDAGHVHYTTQDIRLQILALHSENIRFYLIHSAHHPVIIGLPWLQDHNPHMSWSEKQIIQWTDTCQVSEN